MTKKPKSDEQKRKRRPAPFINEKRVGNQIADMDGEYEDAETAYKGQAKHGAGEYRVVQVKRPWELLEEVQPPVVLKRSPVKDAPERPEPPADGEPDGQE